MLRIALGRPGLRRLLVSYFLAASLRYQASSVDGVTGKTSAQRPRGISHARTNAGKTRWNQANPSQPPKQLLDKPYIPTLNPTGIDVSRRINQDLKGVEPKALSVEEITQRLTKLGPAKGFAQETFEPLYLWYRIFSAGSLHATLNVYDAYY